MFKTQIIKTACTLGAMSLGLVSLAKAQPPLQDSPLKCQIENVRLHADAQYESIGQKIYGIDFACEGATRIQNGWVHYNQVTTPLIERAARTNETLLVQSDGRYFSIIRQLNGVKVDFDDQTTEIPAQHQQTALFSGQSVSISDSPLVDELIAKKVSVRSSGGLKAGVSADGRSFVFAGTTNRQLLGFSLYSPQLQDFTLTLGGEFAKSLIEAMMKQGFSFRTWEHSSYGHHSTVTSFSLMNQKRQMYEECRMTVSHESKLTDYSCLFAPANKDIQ
jgi:hypothetical protein